jgi:hypothetical protein
VSVFPVGSHGQGAGLDTVGDLGGVAAGHPGRLLEHQAPGHGGLAGGDGEGDDGAQAVADQHGETRR